MPDILYEVLLWRKQQRLGSELGKLNSEQLKSYTYKTIL